VERLGRTRRRHSYAGTGSDRAAVVHSYLEVIEYSAGSHYDTATAIREGLDSGCEVGGLGTRRPHSYTGVEQVLNAAVADRFSGTHGPEHPGPPTSRGYEGLDPAEVEELRLRSTRPAVYAALSGRGQGEVVAVSAGYAGLDSVEVEEARRPAGRPSHYENWIQWRWKRPDIRQTTGWKTEPICGTERSQRRGNSKSRIKYKI